MATTTTAAAAVLAYILVNFLGPLRNILPTVHGLDTLMKAQNALVVHAGDARQRLLNCPHQIGGVDLGKDNHVRRQHFRHTADFRCDD